MSVFEEMIQVSASCDDDDDDGGEDDDDDDETVHVTWSDMSFSEHRIDCCTTGFRGYSDGCHHSLG